MAISKQAALDNAKYNSHTYCLNSVVILILLIICLNITAVLQLFAFGIFVIICNEYEYVVQ